MTDLELMKVRALIAEARAASANRHNDFMSGFADLMTEMKEFYQSVAPVGTELPAEIVKRIEEFSTKWAP